MARTLLRYGAVADAPRLPTNVCGQPYSSQIRSQVSKVGERAPVSSSRCLRTLTPMRSAACATDQPACFLSCRSMPERVPSQMLREFWPLPSDSVVSRTCDYEIPSKRRSLW